MNSRILELLLFLYAIFSCLEGNAAVYGGADLFYSIETVMEGNKPEEGYVAAMALLDYPLPPSFVF